jgi:hypothetical protein
VSSCRSRRGRARDRLKQRTSRCSEPRCDFRWDCGAGHAVAVVRHPDGNCRRMVRKPPRDTACLRDCRDGGCDRIASVHWRLRWSNSGMGRLARASCWSLGRGEPYWV